MGAYPSISDTATVHNADMPRPVLYAIVCGSPASRDVGILVGLAQEAGWDACVVASPDALKFLDIPRLAAHTGHPVRHHYKFPGEPDLLPAADAMIVARLFNARVVLHYHSGEADDHLAHWGARVHPWLRLAHEIVVPSEYLRQAFARHGYATRVIPNIVDVTAFRYRDRAALAPRLLCTRNLERYYRVDHVIEAFARFKALVPGATLTIAGYGTEEAHLRDLARHGLRSGSQSPRVAHGPLCFQGHRPGARQDRRALHGGQDAARAARR